MEVWVLSGSITSVWHTSFGLFACLDFGPLRFVCFFFSPFLGCSLFYEVWRGFITWIPLCVHQTMYHARGYTYLTNTALNFELPEMQPKENPCQKMQWKKISWNPSEKHYKMDYKIAWEMQWENCSCPRLRTACEQATLLSSCLPWSFEGIELTRQPKFSLLWVCTSLLACSASSSLQLAADASLSLEFAAYKRRVDQGTDLMSWGESSAPASLHSRFQDFLSAICEVLWVSSQKREIGVSSVCKIVAPGFWFLSLQMQKINYTQAAKCEGRVWSNPRSLEKLQENCFFFFRSTRGLCCWFWS